MFHNHQHVKEFRNWTLFIFESNDKTSKFTEYITGEIPDIVILDNLTQQVINGSILSRDSITYEELKDFERRYKKGEIYLYLSELDNKTIFISKHNNLDTIEFLNPVKLKKIYLSNMHTYGQTTARSKRAFRISKTLQTGGNLSYSLINRVNARFTNKLSFENTLDNGTFISFMNTYHLLHLKGSKLTTEALLPIYPYLLISPNEISYSFLHADNKRFLITKYFNLETNLYSPVNYKYYSLYEVLYTTNILTNLKKSDNILNIGYNLAPIEVIQLSNYQVNDIFCIIPNSRENYYSNVSKKWKDMISNISSIYKFHLEYFEGTSYLLPKLHPDFYGKFNLVVYTVYYIKNEIYMFENFYNTINLFIGALCGLKYTNHNGTFIMHFGNVVFQQTADIFLILKKYFKTADLYYPEISNLIKNSGIMGIFKDFKGIPSNELQELENILNDLQSIYPNNTQDFEVFDKELRDKYNITELLTTNENGFTKPIKYISGFLDIPENKKMDVYKEIIDFNNSIYIKKLLFVQKVIYFLHNPELTKTIKTPTSEQITSSILYCKKYDIQYFNKFHTAKIDSYISRNILSEMYGLTEPILYYFKTPYKVHIADKIILNPRFSKLSSSSASILSTKKNKPITRISRHLDKKTKTRLSNAQSLAFFLKDIMQISNNSRSKSIDKPSDKPISKRYSTLKRVNISLLEPLFTSNNQLVQVGRLIDSRRDFSKPAIKAGMKYDPQTWLYDKLKEQLRYYKGKGSKREVPNLDTLVQERLGDRSISQAWLKMYEIITECDLVPRTQKGTFRSFHLCEAPGTFINALNNYIRTKTNYTDFDWMAQSLHPRLADIKDTYGLIKRHSERWGWGADGTGDITQVANIRYYAKLAKQRFPSGINLMTSDCGLAWGDSKYELVAFASYVAILAILPKGGTMVYKILSPIDLPLIWNLIYITFTNFKELAFFKPVQNSQSREFYIIAKDYLGTQESVIDKLLGIVQRWSRLESREYKAPWLETLDLFRDTYPEEFVSQVLTISERLSQNYTNSIERIIYYMDNYESLGEEYRKHIEKYIEEKNEDWISRYRPRKLENKWIL